MNSSQNVPPPSPAFSLASTAVYFALGGLVTALFSGSLKILAVHADLTEVLLKGMLIPTFTWAVQLTASFLGMSPAARQWYWGDLGRICLLGSIALLPGAVYNFMALHPTWGWSPANVLFSVAVMAWALFQLTARQGIFWGWAASWCVTICVNMSIFYWASRHWW